MDKQTPTQLKSQFNWEFYVSYYKDLSHFKNEISAWRHFTKFGYYENRYYNKECVEEAEEKQLLKDFIFNEDEDINNSIDMYNLTSLNIETISKITKNIDNFSKFIKPYKNILFICSDYPGYGGAATNCDKLSKYYSKTHNVYSIYWNYEGEINVKHECTDNHQNVDQNKLEITIKKLSFKPDIVILKNAVNINLKQLLNCPIIFIVPGIYKNHLDVPYDKLDTIALQNKYINNSTLEQIRMSDYTFCNSSHTQYILENWYKLKTQIFYSTFIQFYGQTIKDDQYFHNRKYQYGLIVSDFDRKIKNVDKSIEFLKNKENAILIGKGSSQYKAYGFECIELVDIDKMTSYYKQIKYIVQDSFYESCSNVKVEGLFNGCKIKQKYHEYTVVVSSTQYPGYGGAATNAYQIIKFLRQNGVNTVGVFFHNRLDVNYDPEEIGGIFLYLSNKYEEDRVRSDVKSYLKVEPNYCLAKNYISPLICKKIFNCYTVYLVSGMNHFNIYSTTSAEELLDNNFIIDNVIKEEVETNTLCESIIVNSELTHKIFTKIYPEYVSKLKPPLDTTFCIKQLDKTFEKEYDIIVICSNFKRESKNNLFLLDVLKNKAFDNYKKIIIGENSDLFKDVKNTVCLPLQIHKNGIEYMGKSKILLHPSLYDSNSNTIREAYYHNCLPIITQNVGYNELFPDYLICGDFTVDEWTNKVKYVLDNYDDVKKTVIDFNTSLDISKLLLL